MRTAPSLFVSSRSVVDIRHIESVLRVDENVYIKFTKKVQERLEKATRENKGRRLAIVVNDKVHETPQITDIIEGRHIELGHPVIASSTQSD